MPKLVGTDLAILVADSDSIISYYCCCEYHTHTPHIRNVLRVGFRLMDAVNSSGVSFCNNQVLFRPILSRKK